MDETKKLQQGSIVQVEITDSNGNIKKRPALVITKSDEILTREQFVGLAITTTFPNPPLYNQVEIPSHPKGYVSTGLRRRSAVVCNWAVVLTEEKILSIKGYLPTNRFIDVMKVRQQFEDEEPSVEE